MKILCFLILVSDAIQPCVQCKFFKKDFWMGPKFGRCTLYPKPVEDNDIDFFVTGIETPKKIDYDYCSVARMCDCKCGKDGKFFQKVQ